MPRIFIGVVFGVVIGYITPVAAGAGDMLAGAIFGDLQSVKKDLKDIKKLLETKCVLNSLDAGARKNE